jgi:ornithine--oxo-acid transaminase
VVADDPIMMNIKPGQHGSTFGGNPLACKVALASLQVLIDEKLAENSFNMGTIFRDKLQHIDSAKEVIQIVRGKGLLNAIVIKERPSGKEAWDFCLLMKEKGLLAKPTHGDIVRLAPPLVMNEKQLLECVQIIKETVDIFSKM